MLLTHEPMVGVRIMLILSSLKINPCVVFMNLWEIKISSCEYKL